MKARRWIASAVLLVACGGDETTRFFPPDDDASTEGDATVVDDLPAPSDITAIDAPVRPDVPLRPDVRPTDRGGSTCPSGCATNADCLPCNESPSDLYCCVSGLCVFTTGGMCMAQPEPGPINENGNDGGDGAAPDASSPFDDTPDPGDDGGMKMPEDVPTPDIDASVTVDASRDAAGDVPNDLARPDGA